MSRYFPPAPESDNDRNAPTTNLQLLRVLGIVGLIGIGIIGAVMALINNLVWLIPQEVEQQLGSMVAPIYELQANESPTQTTLNQLLDRLEVHLASDDRERDFHVVYVPEETVNALALPGDRIIIFRGLLEEVQSENELMMVLGHELGHFVNRDHLRSIVRQLIVPVVVASVFGDMSGLAAAGASVTEALSNAQFSQAQELKADQVGLKLLQETYGHVGGAVDFFVRLREASNANVDFLSTHPLPQRRIDTLEQTIRNDQLPTRSKEPLPLDLRG